jgi:hypothetical protein
VLRFPRHLLLPRLGVSFSWRQLGIHRPPLPLLDAGDVQDGTGPAWARETAQEIDSPSMSRSLQASFFFLEIKKEVLAE